MVSMAMPQYDGIIDMENAYGIWGYISFRKDMQNPSHLSFKFDDHRKNSNAGAQVNLCYQDLKD